MKENDWTTLLEVFDRLQAEIIKEALEAQGISAEIFQEGVAHYIYPVGGPLGKIEICVPASQLQIALAWLDEYQKDLIAEDPESDNPEL